MAEPDATVYVVDDDPSVRRSLGRLLKLAGFHCETLASAEEFLGKPLPDEPACLVLDVKMPGLGGLDLQQLLLQRGAGLPVIFITGHGDIPMSVRAMKSGAFDFLTKPFHGDALLAAVRQAVANHAATQQAETGLQVFRQRFAALSPRERQVMELVVQGMLNKQAGRQLGVTEKTIKAHRAQVMRKMGARSLPDLVRISERLCGSNSSPHGAAAHSVLSPTGV
jgi:FixJ family two-component response regulator